MRALPISLALFALSGCGTQAYTYSGYWTADHFPLGGERVWKYRNEAEHLDYHMVVENISRETIKGDEVVTQGGVIGKISKLGDTYAHIEVANGVELQVQRVAIVQVLPKGTVSK